MSSESFAGGRVVVTGGTRGIGRATALALMRRGAQVLTCSRQDGPETAGLLAEVDGTGHAGSLHVAHADVTTEAGATALATACGERLGAVDILVVNVGVDGHGTVDELDITEWTRILDTNLTSCFLVVRALLPLLQDGAAVTVIGASAALRGRPGSAHYTASKAALIGLTRSLCKELGPRGIRVNLVAPGVVRPDGAPVPEPLRRHVLPQVPLGRFASPEDVADAAVFLSSSAARTISGATLAVDGGM